MKVIGIFYPVLVILPVILCTSCINDQGPEGSISPDHNFEMLTAEFASPGIEYSTAPFWVWNDLVTEEKIDEQLPLFKEQGISQIFIHPRPGLITEYLSEDWFELCKYAVNKGKELNMKIWLYDENSYPSGFAGGHVLAVMPPSFDPVAGLKLTKLNILTEEDTNKYYIIIKKIRNYFANISGGTSNYINQPGEYYAFNKWYYPDNQGWYGGFSYVDLLAYGITERFIQTTMEGYEEYLGEELGSWVPGIFTDEPNINTIGGDNTVIRFTPVLFNKFREKYGYQLQNYLPCLYDEVGDWKNVRHDYYSLLLDMFIDRWSKPWYAYSEENNLIWTGHYWEHGWPNPKHGGDNMAMYAWHQYPGIDMLFNDEERRPDQFGNIRSVKELSSIVNQLDKERALSETYGGSGWELTFEDMKRLGDWEYALGVNFMNQHLSYMTIKGARKRDYPQSMSYHTPWWEHYKPLNTYFQRLSLALSHGEQINRIIILEPTSTAWMYYSPLAPGNNLGEKGDMIAIRESFHQMLTTLEKHQIEYDLGSERMIKDHGRVQDASFVVGQRAYDLVVLPPYFENLEPYVYELLQKYLENGGKVLSFSGIPVHLDGNISRKMPAFINAFREQWMEADELDESVIREYFVDDNFQAIDPANWTGRIFHQRRHFADGQLLFIVNFDPEESGAYHFVLNGVSAVSMDPFTGEYHAFPAQRKEELLSVSGDLAPGGSILLFISEDKIKANSQAEHTQPSTPVQASEMIVERLSPNMLTLDYCNLTLDGRTYNNMYFYDAQEKVFEFYLKEVYGFNYNPWSNAIQYRKRILEKNNFDAGTGFTAEYPFHIRPGFDPGDMRVVVEWPELYTVRCNGVELQAIPGEWWLDRSFGVYDLTDHLKSNRNIIAVQADPMHILAELEPVYITGNFNLESSEKGWIVTPESPLSPGSWKDQGLPFYAGKVSYSRSFIAAKDNGNYLLQLGDWNGTVSEVVVNGVEAGIIGWKPYELDISSLVKDGENTVSVNVIGSLKNLLGPHYNPSVGFVTPWSFIYPREQQPPGNEYHQLDYGLNDPFQIYGP